MANINKEFLDFTQLSAYDTLLKAWANGENQLAYKTALESADGNYLYFYKKPNAVLGTDNPDVQISLGGGDLATKLDALADVAGATWDSKNNIYTIDLDQTFAAGTDTIVEALNELKAQINVLNGNDTTAGSVAKSVKDAVEALDATEFPIAKVSNNVVTIHGVKETDGIVEVGSTPANDITLEEVAYTGAAEDVSYDNTTSGLTATDVQGAIDEVVGGLGTAAAADIATDPIQEQSTDNNLVSASQVATFVGQEIAGLVGAMHFRGVITRQEGETDIQAISRVITDPEAGDTVVMNDNAKEYVYDGTSWREIGDETEFVKKTTTIAGVDLQDNITQSELQNALGLGSAAYTQSSDYDAAGAAAAAVEALDTTSDVEIASHDSSTGAVTFTGSIKEEDGIVDEGTADTITFTPITTTQINSLFS